MRGQHVLPNDIRFELLSAALMLPCAECNMRWSISTEVSAADATPSALGSTTAFVDPKLANAMYQSSEFRGCHVHLSQGELDNLSMKATLLDADPLIEELIGCFDWAVEF